MGGNRKQDEVFIHRLFTIDHSYYACELCIGYRQCSTTTSKLRQFPFAQRDSFDLFRRIGSTSISKRATGRPRVLCPRVYRPTRAVDGFDGAGLPSSSARFVKNCTLSLLCPLANLEVSPIYPILKLYSQLRFWELHNRPARTTTGCPVKEEKSETV